MNILKGIYGLLTALGASLLALTAGHSGASASIYAPGGGTIRALIVGIDDYRPHRPLKGATADAKDLDRSLKAAGVAPANITLLLDWAAKRQAIVAAMERLVATAHSGDLVIVAFAGHGTRLPEMYKNTKRDHMDEVYVLAGFDEESGAGRSEVIAGPEMKHWIGLLDGKGTDIVFIADTCYGGGLTRSIVPESNIMSFRAINVSKAVQLEASALVATAVDAARDESSFHRLTFLAAADPSHEAPEVQIAGEATLRGALSYAFARAIDGSALRPGAVSLSREALFTYARQKVQENTHGKQTIFSEPSRALDAPVFRVAGGGGSAPVFSASPAETGPVRVTVSNGDLALLSKVKSGVAKLEVTADKEKADLVFVPEKHEAVADGDILARDMDADGIPGAADRIYASRALAKLAEDRTQTFQLGPDNSVHHTGEQVTLKADGAGGKFVIAFNITGSGQVQYLWPSQDAGQYPVSGTDWSKNAPVRDPFGSDQVVVIVSPERLTTLESDLERRDGTFAAGELPGIIRSYLDANREVRIGLATIVTAP